MASHSTPHRDPTPGRQCDHDWILLVLFGGGTLLSLAVYAAHHLGWIQ